MADSQGRLKWVIAVGVIAVSLAIYGRLLAKVVSGKGKVSVAVLGIPDALLVFVLGTWLGGMAVHGFSHPSTPRPMNNKAIFESATLFGVLVGGIVFFLTARKISLLQLFGFTRVCVGRIVGIAGSLLLAAFPLTILCTQIMQKYLGDEAHNQEVMQFFQEATERSQWASVAITAFVGVILAPMMEEFLFRGYIYAVLKRFLGFGPAILLSSLLFGAIHLNLMALPALCVLALCLTLAYEMTGSLAVPMTMHALFNFISLAINFVSILWPNTQS